MDTPSWYAMIYTSLLFVTIILFIVSFFTSGISKIACSIAAYSCIASSILMILAYTLNTLTKISNSSHFTTWTYIKRFILVAGPFLLLLGIIGYSLYLLITYQNRISDGHIANEYTTFSTISIILMLLDIYVFYSAMNSQQFTTTGRMPSISYSIMYLIGVINLICVLIMGTILKYFVTDG